MPFLYIANHISTQRLFKSFKYAENDYPINLALSALKKYILPSTHYLQHLGRERKVYNHCIVRIRRTLMIRQGFEPGPCASQSVDLSTEPHHYLLKIYVFKL